MPNEEKQKMLLKNLNRVIFVLSLLGIVMAAYVLQSWLRKTSIICLTGGCETVRKSAFSYPFGIPVPSIGLVGYSFLTVLAFLRTTSPAKWIRSAMLGMGIFGVCFVTWFTYTEIFIIKGICMWCAISAVNMYVITALIWKSLKLEPKK